MLYVLLGLLGLCVGSFLNAWIWRTREQSLTKNKKQKKALSITTGRSMCPSCGHQLAARDLIPVFSWIALRGKCRYCRSDISLQYPLVELATGALFVFSYMVWPVYIAGPDAAVRFVCWLFLLSVLIALTVYDAKYMLLPNRFVAWAAVPVVIWVLYETLVIEQSADVIIAAVIGLVSLGGFFYVLFQVSGGKWIGGGDVKLGFVLGAWLADPVLSLLAIFLASIIGTVIILAISLRRPVSRNMKLPFGPLLIAGFTVAFLFGIQLIDVYENLLLRT